MAGPVDTPMMATCSGLLAVCLGFAGSVWLCVMAMCFDCLCMGGWSGLAWLYLLSGIAWPHVLYERCVLWPCWPHVLAKHEIVALFPCCYSIPKIIL